MATPPRGESQRRVPLLGPRATFECWTPVKLAADLGERALILQPRGRIPWSFIVSVSPSLESGLYQALQLLL